VTQLVGFDGGNSSAVISPCNRYRYRLSRDWGDSAKRCLFVMLNPSTADAVRTDPTFRRCIKFAQQWGFGAVDVGNLYGFRATRPSDMRKAKDPIGPENDQHLRELARRASRIVVAWGEKAEPARADAVVRLLEEERPFEVRFCFGWTKDGQPLHPLFQPANAILHHLEQWGGR
jgi:hypothetical protein